MDFFFFFLQILLWPNEIPAMWLFTTSWSVHSHVGGEDSIDEILLREVEGALQLMVVEGNISRAGTVESSLHEGGPCVFQQETTTDVILTHTGHTREDRLPTVLLYCVLSQKEVREAAHLVCRDKVRFCRDEEKEEAGYLTFSDSGVVWHDKIEKRSLFQ